MEISPRVSLLKRKPTKAIKKPKVKKSRRGIRVGDFDSKLEKEFFDKYHKTKYLKHHPFILEYKIEETRKYTPDFEDQETGVLYEVKGYFDLASRQKMARIKKSNPNLRIIMCFDKDNKIHKNGNMKYSDWCKKYRIDYCLDLALDNVVTASNPNSLPESERRPRVVPRKKKETT